jgi:glycine/D-amino acid oxidase-like deaminating enzyme
VLLQRFSAHGGQLVTHAGDAAIEIANARVTGVRTADGKRFSADAALLATGAAVPDTVAPLGHSIPDASPIGVLVRTKPVAHKLRAVLNTPRAAIRPTPTGALVVDSGWVEREVVRHGDGTFSVGESTLAGLLREASAVLEGNPQLVMESYGMGPKPVPGDGDPVLGPLDNVAGYHIAFSHSGATLGLIAGEALAGEIMTGEPNPLLEAFRPSRFR